MVKTGIKGREYKILFIRMFVNDTESEMNLSSSNIAVLHYHL